MAAKLIAQAKATYGVKTPEARQIVARQIGVAPGALERLLAGRLVHIERIAENINQYVGGRLERATRELEREIWIARTAGNKPDQGELEKAEAAVRLARDALNRWRGE